MRRQARREHCSDSQQDEGERAEHLRSLSEHARHDPCVLRGRRERVPADGLAHAVEQQVARLAQVSADDDHARG